MKRTVQGLPPCGSVLTIHPELVLMENSNLTSLFEKRNGQQQQNWAVIEIKEKIC